MNCAEVQVHLGSYADRELDAAVRAEIDQHLTHCAACFRVFLQQETLHALLKHHAPDFRATPQLRARIESSLPTDRKTPFRIAMPKLTWWRFATTIALTAVIAWGFNALQREGDIDDNLKDAAVTVHMRALSENHLVDLASAEPARLEQWFKARLPYSSAIKDLSGNGYALVGGRLEYLYKRPLAAVVYRHGANLINVLVWPAAKTDRFPSALLIDEGLKIVFWTRDDRNFCAISDLSQDEFFKFVRALQDA